MRDQRYSDEYVVVSITSKFYTAWPSLPESIIFPVSKYFFQILSAIVSFKFNSYPLLLSIRNFKLRIRWFTFAYNNLIPLSLLPFLMMNSIKSSYNYNIPSNPVWDRYYTIFFYTIFTLSYVLYSFNLWIGYTLSKRIGSTYYLSFIEKANQILDISTGIYK